MISTLGRCQSSERLYSCEFMRSTTLIAILIGAAACGGTTDVGSPGVPVAGLWSYAGQQVAPGSAALGGTLSFTEQTGARIGGTLDFVETDAHGQQRRVAGPFAGRTVDSTTLDFEVILGAVSRRHVGKVRADSLTGTWVESSTDGLPTASGTFRSARNHQ
jgi:hypothetical protein